LEGIIAEIPTTRGWGSATSRSRTSAIGSDLTRLSLEELMNVEVVYAASKHIQKTSEAPSSVSIVTVAEIRQFGYRTLADILQSLRGFYVTSDRNYSYVGVRGFGRSGDYNARVLVLVDGHRINDNIYEGVLIEGGFPVDPDLIDRVEVVRGPSSSIYGNNAFFAVVNVITRKGGTLDAAEISAEAASFDTYKERVTFGKKLEDGPEFLLSGSFLDSKGQRLFFPEFDSPDTNHGMAENADGERLLSLFGNVSYRGFTLQAAHVLREKGIPTASFGTVFNDPRTKTWDQRTYVTLEYDRPLFSDLSIRARASWDRDYYWGNYVYDYPPVTVSGFYYTIDGRIAYRLDPETGFSQYRNTEKIESKGVEVEASAQLPGGATGRASWAYQQTEEVETGNALVNSPRHLLKLNLAVPLFEEKLSAGLEGRYTTRRLTLAGNEIGGFFLANLTLLSRSLLHGLDLSASIYNVLDRRYGDPGAEEHQQDVIPQDGRSFRLKATYRF
jgi:outer membrane receptor protein involved in Fe transport